MANRSNFLVLVLILITVSCTVNVSENEWSHIRDKWLPDSRLALFTFQLKKVSGELVVKGETTIPEAKDELLKALTDKYGRVVDSLIVLPDDNWGLICLSTANLRDASRHSAQLVTQAILGTPVKILKRERGWSLVQLPDKYIAWTNNSSIHKMSNDEMMTWRQSKRIIALEEGWLVDNKGCRVSDLVKGSILTWIKNNDNDVLAKLPDGREGWVSSKKVKELDEWCNKADLKAGRLVDQARQYMGLPYLWGGTTSKALDCSGFVKTVYFMNGIVVARDASQQMDYGKTIELDISQLKSGDLLFFGYKEPLNVTHVGMYIGDTEYIHCSGRVKINSLDSTRCNYIAYSETEWLGAQRYLGYESEDGVVPLALHPWYEAENK